MGEVIRLNGRIGFRGYTEKDIVSKDDGGVLTFSPTNIVDNKLTTNCKNTYITRFKYDESPEIKIHNGDILFVKTGSTLGKSALVTGLSEDATLNPQVVVMRTNNLNAEFLAAMLVTNAIISQVNSAKIGGAVPTLTETRIKDFDVAIPVSEAEKEQIGQFFSQLDHLITLHQRQPFLHSSPEISLTVQLIHPFYTSSWEQRKLGKLLKTITTGKSVNSDDGAVAVGDIGILKTSCVSYDRFNPYESKPVVKDELQSVKCAVEKDSVIVSRMNTPERVGACGYVSTDFPNLFLPDRLWKLKFQDNVDAYFVYMMLVSSVYKEKITSMASGTSGSMYNIPKETFLNLQLVVPVQTSEQRKIGQVLRQLNDLITLHQRKGKQPSPAAPMMQIIQKVFIVKHGISDINVKKSQISTDSMLNCSVHLLRIG